MGYIKTTERTIEATTEVNTKFISKSGIYDIIILNAIVDDKTSGSTAIDFYISHQDNPQFIYSGVYVTNKDKKDNTIGQRIMNSLLVIANITDIQDDDTIDDCLPIGKAKAMKDVKILYPLNDTPVKIRLQKSYSLYQGKITETLKVRGFYDTNGATSEEIVKVENGEDKSILGKKLKMDLRYADNIEYQDGVTEDDVKLWLETGRKDTVQVKAKVSVGIPSFAKE